MPTEHALRYIDQLSTIDLNGMTVERVTKLLANAACREVMDTDGAARHLGVSRQLLELLRLQGGGPRYAKLGRLVRYRRQSLDDWLIACERNNTSETP